MSDLICRKSMTRCQTPGVCSPHGGCQPESISDGQYIDLGKFIDHVWAIKTERDQLKAEVAGLRTGYEAYEQVNAGLKAEIEALRKDAERYEWYKAASDFDREKLSALDGEDADAYVDAAMGKGEQS